MAVYIKPGKCSGKITVPPSKSLSHRALLAAFLSEETSVISNLLICDDVLATLGIMKALGKNVINEGNSFFVSEGNRGEDNIILNANESGSTLRFIIPILSLLSRSFRITGSKKLLSRPLDIYKKIYQDQGLKFELSGDYLEVEGKLKPGLYELPGNVSSQFISGLMFALPLLEDDSKITIVGKYESKSYVDLTIDVLDKFGVHIQIISENEYYIKGNQKYKGAHYFVSGDYSQMAFWAVLATINNDLEILGMEEESLQGDKEIVNILKQYNKNIEYADKSFIVSKSDTKGMRIDLSMIPDLGPILSVLASTSYEESVICNCARLRYKESDRLEAIKQELNKMNIAISIVNDSLIIKKKDSIINLETIDSHNDHRIFMALAILGTISDNGVKIDNEGCINKSYPNFLNDLISVGIEVKYE